MNLRLKAIDDLLEVYRPYLFPSPEEILAGERMTAEERDLWKRNRKEADEMHMRGIKQLLELFPSLSAEEVVEGYRQGGVVLQAALSGLMGNHF
ncbi:MAG: hypothetical protein HC876_19935 [Chloroflexaceae bacterium]|nr:hypothetical protein [Chloroflexaceae bacterium]